MRLILTYPHSLGAPGGGTHDCLQLARHMARLGAEVTLVHLASLGPTRFPRPRPPAEYSGEAQAAELRGEGIRVLRVDRHPLHYVLDGRPVKRAVASLLDQEPFDALLGWWNETFFLPRLLRQRGVLVAMNAAASYGPLYTGSGAVGPHRRLRNHFFFTRPLRTADVVFARSGFTRSELIELAGVAPERIHVAHLGVDEVFVRVPRAPEPEDAVRRLLYIGTLTKEKGLFDLLAALGRVERRTPAFEWRLRIGGWGDADEVRRRAREHGIETRIELLGRLDRPAVLAALEWAQLSIHPSYTESFGLANAEAQAAGVPVVAYDVAAVPEVIAADETGWLAPLKDVDALAAAIGEALSAPAECHRRGLAARERMARRFTWDQTARRTLAGLEEELARASRGG